MVPFNLIKAGMHYYIQLPLHLRISTVYQNSGHHALFGIYKEVGEFPYRFDGYPITDRRK